MFSGRGQGGRHSRGGRDRRADPAGAEWAPAERFAPGVGPYDVTEAPADVQRLDLGSLRIPTVEGVEMRIQADPDGQVQQVVLVDGENALQLGVFAAPRSDGIWDEVREEIRQSLAADGVVADERAGDYGPELRARVRTPEGLTDIRFVGVDGPRWMVRGVFQGPAALEPSSSPALLGCLRGLVVDRGHEAKPVREPLPLRLPKEMAEQAAEQQAAEQAAAAVASAAERTGFAAGTNGAAPPGQAGPSGQRRRPSPRPRRDA